MKICQKCNSGFNPHPIINGKRRNCYDRIFCFSCSPFGAHNTKNIAKYNSDNIIKKDGIMYKTCPSCKSELPLTAEHYYMRKNGVSHYHCKKCIEKNSLISTQAKKDKCIAYKGSKCVLCGYNRFRNTFDFHHLCPSEKSFEIGYALKRKSFDEIKPELDKCILLCANCHRELHGGFIVYPTKK